MKRLMYLLPLIISIISLPSCSIANNISKKRPDVSPYDYGLSAAKNGVERYQVLLKTHLTAIAAGVDVDYSNIDTIKLEIPGKPSRIPLTQNNDFKGCVFIVKNTSKDVYLFEKKNPGTPIEVDKVLIDKGDFRAMDSLRYGRRILLIEDDIPWVRNRIDHEYGHQRKDVLLIENGVAKNKVVMPYNNECSKPKCSYIRLEQEPLIIKNVTIKRSPDCSYLTHIAMIVGCDDVRVSNVNVYTPASKLANDRGILIRGCTNVTFKDIRIEGSYSQTTRSGYGVSLDNVWNFKAIRMYGKAIWGIFGNNNINKAIIEDSQINRFDIHCYGRDISFRNVDFFDLYNQYSSVYGTILFDRCSFTDFVPVQNGGSYYSYVAHDLVFNNCVFNVTPKKNYIISVSHLNKTSNMRQELAEKRLPNVRIKNMIVNMRDGADDLILFRCTSSGKKISNIGYLSDITIDGLAVNSDGDKPVKGVTLINITMETSSAVACQMKNVVVNQPHKGIVTKGVINDAILRTNMPIKGGKVIMTNVYNLKQQ